MRYLPALLLIAFMPAMSISAEFDQPQEAAGKLLTEIAKMDGQIFKAKGVLKRSFFSDNDDPRYVMQVGNRKSTAHRFSVSIQGHFYDPWHLLLY
jgi:hypothetical protein